jgi:hypothetical protein
MNRAVVTTPDTIPHIMSIAATFDVATLKTGCHSALLQQLSTSNACALLSVLSKLNPRDEAYTKCREYILEHAKVSRRSGAKTCQHTHCRLLRQDVLSGDSIKGIDEGECSSLGLLNVCSLSCWQSHSRISFPTTSCG